MFKNRFWFSLILAVPVVLFSPMFADLIGYSVPEFPGSTWIAPVLGTVIFVYGGSPFIKGGWTELRSRQPGMMLLIAMAITVAFVASWVTTLGIGGFHLDFWWELAGPDPRKVDTSGSGPFDPAGLITHDPNTYAP